MIEVVRDGGYEPTTPLNADRVRFRKGELPFRIYVGLKRTSMWRHGAGYPHIDVRTEDFRKMAGPLLAHIPGDDEWNEYLEEELLS